MERSKKAGDPDTLVLAPYLHAQSYLNLSKTLNIFQLQASVLLNGNNSAGATYHKIIEKTKKEHL